MNSVILPVIQENYISPSPQICFFLRACIPAGKFAGIMVNLVQIIFGMP